MKIVKDLDLLYSIVNKIDDEEPLNTIYILEVSIKLNELGKAQRLGMI